MTQDAYNHETREVTIGLITLTLHAHKDLKLKTKPWRVHQPLREGEGWIEGKGQTPDEAFNDWVATAKIVG